MSLSRLSTIASLALAAYAAPTSYAAPTTSSAPAWPQQTYNTEPFTSPLLNVTQTGSTAPGLIWFTPALFFGTTRPDRLSLSPLLANQQGDVIFHGPTFPDGQPDFFANFRTQVFSNATVLSYYQGRFDGSLEQSIGNVTFLDDTYKAINLICLRDYPVFIPGFENDCKVDLHESRAISGDRFIVTTHNTTQADLSSIGGPKDGWVTDSQFLVINPWTEEILFRWASLEHLDRLPISDTMILLTNREGQPLGNSAELPFDYFHINSVDTFEDGYVVSARHFSSAVFLDKYGNVTRVLNGKVGHDYQLASDSHFAYQHDVHAQRMANGDIRVTMFDDENYDVPPPTEDVISSGLELFLNDQAMTAVLGRRLFNNNTVEAPGLGSWQDQSNGNTFIGFATSPMISEYNSQNQEIYNLQYGFSSPGSFRSYKFDGWHGTPFYPPKVVAQLDEDGSATVFVSWNGATDVVSWDVMANNGSGSLMKVASAEKGGFETAIIISTKGLKNFRVNAIGAQGAVLAQSQTVSAN